MSENDDMREVASSLAKIILEELGDQIVYDTRSSYETELAVATIIMDHLS